MAHVAIPLSRVLTATGGTALRGQSGEQFSSVTIDSRAGLNWRMLRDLWSYRELLVSLTVRETKSRYRQSLLGVGWAQDTAKQDMKDAGHETKQAAKDTGHATKKTAHKAGHKVKKGTNKAAQKTEHGAQRVEDKTSPQ